MDVEEGAGAEAGAGAGADTEAEAETKAVAMAGSARGLCASGSSHMCCLGALEDIMETLQHMEQAGMAASTACACSRCGMKVELKLLEDMLDRLHRMAASLNDKKPALSFGVPSMLSASPSPTASMVSAKWDADVDAATMVLQAHWLQNRLAPHSPLRGHSLAPPEGDDQTLLQRPSTAMGAAVIDEMEAAFSDQAEAVFALHRAPPLPDHIMPFSPSRDAMDIVGVPRAIC